VVEVWVGGGAITILVSTPTTIAPTLLYSAIGTMAVLAEETSAAVMVGEETAMDRAAAAALFTLLPSRGLLRSPHPT